MVARRPLNAWKLIFFQKECAMAKNIRFPVILSLVFFLAGCIMPPPRPPLHADPFNPLKRVAVLPMKNDTTDVDGPNVVRQKMAEALKQRSYVVQDLKETDRILRDQMGITLGGQFDMTTAQKVGEALGVEGVLYGTLMDFDETTTGVVNVKKVRGKFRLVNTQTGQAIWSRGLGVRAEVKMAGAAGAVASTVSKAADARDKEAPWVTIESRATGNDSFGKSLVMGLGSKLVSKAMGIHLEHESAELARLVSDNLPWGPGELAAPTRPAPVQIGLPDIKVPEPPSFGHMEFGKKDFSAVMISTTINKANNQTMIMEALIAKAGEKFRTEMDLSKTVKGQQGMPPEFSRMVVIARGDKHVVYTLYPNKRRYIVHPEGDDEKSGREPRIEKIKVGSEIIDGHPADKFRVRMVQKDDSVFEGFIWNAKDLDGMTIRTETENNDFKTVMELKRIVLRRPDPPLFEIPAGYVEAEGFLDLMTDQGGRRR